MPAIQIQLVEVYPQTMTFMNEVRMNDNREKDNEIMTVSQVKKSQRQKLITLRQYEFKRPHLHIAKRITNGGLGLVGLGSGNSLNILVEY